MWEKYSQGTNPDRPVKRTLDTACCAMRDGYSDQEIEEMLMTADPHVKQVAQKQGKAKAENYSNQVIRSAEERQKKQ